MTLTDECLVLYSDNALGSKRKQLLLKAALSDRGLAETLLALDGSRLPFKQAYEMQMLLPIPDALRQGLQGLGLCISTESVDSVDGGHSKSS